MKKFPLAISSLLLIALICGGFFAFIYLHRSDDAQNVYDRTDALLEQALLKNIQALTSEQIGISHHVDIGHLHWRSIECPVGQTAFHIFRIYYVTATSVDRTRGMIFQALHVQMSPRPDIPFRAGDMLVDAGPIVVRFGKFLVEIDGSQDGQTYYSYPTNELREMLRAVFKDLDKFGIDNLP